MMTMQEAALLRRSHADADRAARTAKARQIEAVLQLHGERIAGKDVLDIGTGAGYIASHFSRTAASVRSVDVNDERKVLDFTFTRVESEALPFDDAAFDVVVSNHVVEHVLDQIRHLSEIRRVLRGGGVCYLATPNRFALIEPHFKLPLLSWLPESWRDAYVRLGRRGERYDVTPLTYGWLATLADHAGLAMEDASRSVVTLALMRRTGVGIALPIPSAILPSFVVLLRVRP